MSHLDNKALLSYVRFSAVDHDRLPKYGPRNWISAVLQTNNKKWVSN